MPAYCHPRAFAAFERELPALETTAGLFRAAFAVACHEQPDADLMNAESVIAKLADTVRGRVNSPKIEPKLAHLHDVLFDVVGFIGNVEDYYNPANSYIPEVLRTHRGLPITLVLIYKSVAEQIGLEVRGINSPGHFLAAVRNDESVAARSSVDTWSYVDPFFGGELLKREDVLRRVAETTGRPTIETPQLLRPASHRQWLARMLNNLQAIFAHSGRERDLYAMQELQILLVQR